AVRGGRAERIEADGTRHTLAPEEVEAVADDEDVADVPSARDLPDRLHALPGVLALVLLQDRLLRYATIEQVLFAHARLGINIALKLSAGHDDVWRVPTLVQRESMVQPRAENATRATVVLGGTHHDDRVRLA